MISSVPPLAWRHIGAVALVTGCLLTTAFAVVGWAHLEYQYSTDLVRLTRLRTLDRAEAVAREACWRAAYGRKVVGEWVDGWVTRCAQARLAAGAAETARRLNEDILWLEQRRTRAPQ